LRLDEQYKNVLETVEKAHNRNSQQILQF